MINLCNMRPEMNTCTCLPIPLTTRHSRRAHRTYSVQPDLTDHRKSGYGLQHTDEKSLTLPHPPKTPEVIIVHICVCSVDIGLLSMHLGELMPCMCSNCA